MIETEHRIRSYVLRSGRITAAQDRCYNLLLPHFCIPLLETNIDAAKIFNNDNPLIIEIGFGSGIATSIIAKNNPCKNYIGIEVFKGGIGKLLMSIEAEELKNIRIIEGDAQLVLPKMIADNFVSGFNIFFPDPWHKKRCHKRRLVQRPFTDTLAAKLKEGGTLHFATDIENYADFALKELSNTVKLKNCFDGFAPLEFAGLHRPKTKFEDLAIKAGRQIFDIVFSKCE